MRTFTFCSIQANNHWWAGIFDVGQMRHLHSMCLTQSLISHRSGCAIQCQRHKSGKAVLRVNRSKLLMACSDIASQWNRAWTTMRCRRIISTTSTASEIRQRLTVWASSHHCLDFSRPMVHSALASSTKGANAAQTARAQAMHATMKVSTQPERNLSALVECQYQKTRVWGLAKPASLRRLLMDGLNDLLNWAVRSKVALIWEHHS